MFYHSNYNFQKGENIEGLHLIKKIYGTDIYETWEVKKFETIGFKPYIAHIFKYVPTGFFPIKEEDLDNWCKNIETYNKSLEFKMLDVRVMPCYKKKSFKVQTKTGKELAYLLFEHPDGGYKLEDSCTENNTFERICRYSIKNLTKGYLRLLQMAHSVTKATIQDLYFLTTKGAFYYGQLRKHIPEQKGQVQKENNEKKEKVKHYFQIVPFFRVFKPDDCNNVSKLVKEDLQAQLKIRMYEFGKFLMNFYKGFDETKESKLFATGDNFIIDEEIESLKVVDIFVLLNKDELDDGKAYENHYFGIPKKFADVLQQYVDKKAPIEKLTQNAEYLKNSFYDFLHKLVDYNGKQFANVDEAVNHKFLKGNQFLTKVESDTGEI